MLGGLLTQGRFDWNLDHSTCFSETSLGAPADKAGRGWLAGSAPCGVESLRAEAGQPSNSE